MQTPDMLLSSFEGRLVTARMARAYSTARARVARTCRYARIQAWASSAGFFSALSSLASFSAACLLHLTAGTSGLDLVLAAAYGASGSYVAMSIAAIDLRRQARRCVDKVPTFGLFGCACYGEGADTRRELPPDASPPLDRSRSGLDVVEPRSLARLYLHSPCACCGYIAGKHRELLPDSGTR